MGLLFDAVPDDCALVVVGDGTSAASDAIERAPELGYARVLPRRRMLKAEELRTAYSACDVFAHSRLTNRRTCDN